MARKSSDARIIARLDDEEQTILRRVRAATGKNTSGVIKAALRVYSEALPAETPLDILQRYGVVGALSGPTDLSENYKQQLDYAAKHGDVT